MALQEGTTRAGDRDGTRESWARAQREARDLGGEIARIAAGLRELSQREMDLARAEMLDSRDAARSAGVWAGVAAVLGLIAVQFLAVAGMFGLAELMPMWGAALATAGVLIVLAAIGALMVRRAMSDLNIVPSHTIRSVQEDIRWAREHVQRNSA